jgi:hypothetical protein
MRCALDEKVRNIHGLTFGLRPDTVNFIEAGIIGLGVTWQIFLTGYQKQASRAPGTFYELPRPEAIVLRFLEQ